MSQKHLRTVEQFFRHPPSMNVTWTKVVHMFEALGADVQVVHGRQMIVLNGQRATFSIPHGKSIQSKDQVVAIRHFLEAAGVTPESLETGGDA